MQKNPGSWMFLAHGKKGKKKHGGWHSGWWLVENPQVIVGWDYMIPNKWKHQKCSKPTTEVNHGLMMIDCDFFDIQSGIKPYMVASNKAPASNQPVHHL